MHPHTDDTHIHTYTVTQACHALGALAFHSALNQVAITQKGDITAIVSALKQHPMHAGVQAQCCNALMNLVR